MRLTKAIMVLGFVLGFAARASAVEVLVTFPTSPFYTNSSLNVAEGGAVQGSFVVDPGTSAISQVHFITTAGMTVPGVFVLDQFVGGAISSGFEITDASTLADFATNPTGTTGDEVMLITFQAATGPTTGRFAI